MKRTIRLMTFFFVGAFFVAVAAQPSAQPKPAEPTAEPQPGLGSFVSRLKAGMTEERVAEIVGRPRDRDLRNDYARRIIGGDSLEVWESPTENLLVIFEHGKVASFRAVSPALTDDAWEWKRPSETTEPQLGTGSLEAQSGSGSLLGQQQSTTTGPPPAAGTTWHGLRFGMTVEEVKGALKGAVIVQEREPGYFSIGTVTVKNTIGKGELTFGDAKTLERVFLDFSRHEETDEMVKRTIAYQDVAEGLLEKYGAPANQTGYCPTVQEVEKALVYRPRGMMQCTRLWKEPAQTIKMDFSFVVPALFLSVEYKSVRSDL
jgi:hypothetical protein